jgi:hypothetical protein
MTPALRSTPPGSTRISWKARALAAEKLLARQMWLDAELTKAGVPVARTQAVEEWDNHRLHADVYDPRADGPDA